MIPNSFTAFKRSLKMDDTVRIVSYTHPWHTRTTTVETLTLHGFQTTTNERGKYGGEQMSDHVTWPAAAYTECIDNGIALLCVRPREIWEWSEEYGGSVSSGMWLDVGEPWMTVTKPGYSPDR